MDGSSDKSDEASDRRTATAARLTPMEQRIVELVCRGLTNPQIARELFVEHSTVRWHLRNVFRKLGVRTRTELASIQLSKGTNHPGMGQNRELSPTSVEQAHEEPKRTQRSTT